MDADISHRKPRGQGPSRRGEILAAAKRLFLSEGFENATIRKIAASVGVSSGTLYLYFPDKDAILRGIAEDTFAVLLATLEQAGKGTDDPLVRLRAGLQAYIAFGRRHPDEYRLTFLSKMIGVSAPGRPAAACTDIEAADRSFDMLLQDVTLLIAAGVFRPGDPCAAAEALWVAAHGITSVLLDHCGAIKTEPDHLVDTVIEIAIGGLVRK